MAGVSDFGLQVSSAMFGKLALEVGDFKPAPRNFCLPPVFLSGI
jgi:hypothetical protein